MRRCRLCGKEIPAKYWLDGRRLNLQNRKYCLECSPYRAHNTRRLHDLPNEVSRQRMTQAARREMFRRYQSKKRQQRKEALVQLLGGGCAICGYSLKCPAAFCFHHRNPEEKSFTFSRQGLLGRWEELLAEVAKCVLLCCRCHAEVRSGLHTDLEVVWRDR